MSSENDLNDERLEDLSVFLFELFAADLKYTQKLWQKAHLERLPEIAPLRIPEISWPRTSYNGEKLKIKFPIAIGIVKSIFSVFMCSYLDTYKPMVYRFKFF